MAKRLRPSRRPSCFHCGKRLTYAAGVPVFEVVPYHNAVVKLHKGCVEGFQREQRNIMFRNISRKPSE